MYCGIDLGTSSLKCLLVDQKGKTLGFAQAAVSLDLQDGRYCSDPAQWLEALASAISQALSNVPEGASKIRALAISGNGPTLVSLDKKDEPVGRAVSWMDKSALAEARQVSLLAGKSLDASFYLPKAIRALNEKEGKRISRFFSAPEYLAYTLGGEAVSYMTDDFYEPYLWCLSAAKTLALDASLFPRYVKPATRIGAVSAQAEKRFGLKKGTPIISAFPDFLSALLGTGTVSPGMACDRSGSSEAINLCVSAPAENSLLFALPHAIPGLWNLSGGVSTSGKAIEWFASAAGYQGGNSALVIDEARLSVPGARGLCFLPYLNGERAPLWKADLRASFIGLDTSHTRADMARAVLEGICFGLRLACDEMALLEQRPASIRCSGGLARSETVCRIKADILEAELQVPFVSDAETLGNAAACAVALGDYSSLSQAAAAMVHIEKAYAPDASAKTVYAERYAQFSAQLGHAGNKA